MPPVCSVELRILEKSVTLVKGNVSENGFQNKTREVDHRIMFLGFI